MPSIEELSKIVEDKRFMEVFTAPRPEGLNLRTSAGTGDRLEIIRSKGVGKSKSEVAHIAIQIGLFALEDSFLSDDEE